MIPRMLFPLIQERLFSRKAILLLGARQTGKTTLMQQLAAHSQTDALVLNCDEPTVRAQLQGISLEAWRRIIGTHRLILIDEAQRVPDIGLALKLVTDQLPGVQLLVGGSSALELAASIYEPLTGRQWEYHLYPVSWEELVRHAGYLGARMQLEQRMIYGMYPEVITYPESERSLLQQLAGSYLYKDLLSLGAIRRPELLDKLLRALALQVGNKVSYNELSDLLQADKRTVSQYIDLLEQAYIIFRLPAFSRNLRNEISNGRKIYFYDNGIRNALIANFNPIELRQDTGALWENFMISERVKYLHYRQIWANRYFWRTVSQQEIDYLEDRDGRLYAFEFKWNPKRTARIPATFRKAYPESEVQVITPDTMHLFVGDGLDEAHT